MLTELAIGDAYGACFEYVDFKVARGRNLLMLGYQSNLHGYKKRNHTGGLYTDDTQQAIAIAECVIETSQREGDEDDHWNELTIARSLVRAFARDARTGYSQRMYRFLMEATEPLRNANQFTESELDDRVAFFLTALRAPSSDDKRKGPRESSGAAMRAPPIGVFPSIEKVKERAAEQAVVTHVGSAIDAAVASALMTHYFAHAVGPKCELGEFIAAHVPHNWKIPWWGPVGSRGIDSVNAALSAVLHEGTLSGLMRRCVDYTGDVDTVAAVALAAASCSPEVLSDIPESFHRELENGEFGYDYLNDLNGRLMAVADGRPDGGE